MTYEIHCHKCGRFLGNGTTSMSLDLKCSNCKSLDHYQYVDLAHYVPNSKHGLSVSDVHCE